MFHLPNAGCCKRPRSYFTVALRSRALFEHSIVVNDSIARQAVVLHFLGAMDTDGIDVMISQVADRQVQDVLRVMHQQHQKQYQSYVDVVEGAVSRMQQSFNERLHPPPMPVPLFIEAQGRSSPGVGGSSSPKFGSDSGGSFSCHSSMTDSVAIKSQEGAIVGLKCLFCPHFHLIEKSHYQHYDRMLSRLETGVPYSGKCFIPDTHWLFRLVGFGDNRLDIVRKFLSTLLSHLHSGNEKAIDPVRAANVVAWLSSLPRS